MIESGHQTTGSTGQPATDRFQSYPRWPVALLAASAFVAIWGGWVELGRMSGFGPVNLLPGIAEFYVDLAITLPLGMEVYAAYAMGAWLTRKQIDDSARSFAKRSALVSLVVGAAGQVAYHLLAAAGIERAPWLVVVIVSCVPVAVLGMASMLAHRLHVPADQPAALVAPNETQPVNAAHDVDELLADFAAPQAAEDQADQRTGRKHRPVTVDERAMMVRLSQSLSEREISRRMKRSRDTIRRVLEDAANDVPATESATGPADRHTDEAVWSLAATA